MNSKIKKLLKYFLIFLGAIIAIAGLWFLLKPLRIAKADEYLKEGTLIGYQKASVLTPFSPYVYLQIGLAYEEQNQLSKAEKEFQKISYICKRFSWKNAGFKTCPEYKEGYFRLKKIKIQEALKTGNVAEAEAALAETLELNSSDSEVQLYLGMVLISQGNYDDAKKSLENSEKGQILLSALKKTNNLSVKTGAAFLKMGYENLAILQFEKAIELDSNYRDAHVYLGKAYLQQQNPEKAKESLERAAKIDPINAETFYLLSEVYDKLKDSDASQKSLSKAKLLGWKE